MRRPAPSWRTIPGSFAVLQMYRCAMQSRDRCSIFSSSHVAADGAVASGDRSGVADHHAGVLPAAGELDGVGGGPAGGQLDGESHAAAVRGSAALEAGASRLTPCRNPDVIGIVDGAQRNVRCRD